MENELVKKIVLIVFSLLCLACVAGITLVLYDVVSVYSGSSVTGLGAISVFLMILAFAIRRLWESRQLDP